MADSIDNHSKRLQDFSDEFDAMLDDTTFDEQRVGLIDDDEAIDRLLVGDVFEKQVDENEADQSLLADNDRFAEEVDDLFADIQINPGRQQAEPVAEASDVPDEFDDRQAPLPEFSAVAPDDVQELEGMSEIDEFADEPLPVEQDERDLKMDEFDISADDDDIGIPALTDISLEDDMDDEFAEIGEIGALPALAEIDEEPVSEENQAVDEIAANIEDDESGDSAVQFDSTALQAAQAMVTELTGQIRRLTDEQAEFREKLAEQEAAQQTGQSRWVDDFETLQADHRKLKRGVDALAGKKPVMSYIALGVGVIAVIMASVLIYTGMTTQGKVAELTEAATAQAAKLDAVAASAGANDMQSIMQRLDEMSASNAAFSAQLSELTKGAVPGDNLNKQLADLASQNMQMGGIVESLQQKVAQLEKARHVVAVKEPASAKPTVPEPTWNVNLIAFKQDWYAAKKAEEFGKQGVPAEVSRAESKGEIWYRLSVKGFKSQSEASAYAAKVKKALNLTSVWVTKN